MNHQEAISHALSVADLLIKGSQIIGNETVHNQRPMPSLAILLAASNRDCDALDCTFKEILIYGSAAEGDEEPGDVDMLVFDLGFYSSVLRMSNHSTMYGTNGVKDNLRKLLVDWFGFDEYENPVRHAIFGQSTDLLVLPLKFFTDQTSRDEISNRQRDPEFFQNAFSKMLRFDFDTKQFVPVDLDYFEAKYGAEIDTLRKIETAKA